MKLLFKQRLFSWFDSYDVYDANGNTVFTVKGQLSWGHCLKIFGADGSELGTVKERVLTFLPKFEVYQGSRYIGCISKEFSLFTPKFSIDFNGWDIDGNWLEWDYSIRDKKGHRVAAIYKKLFRLTDTYVIDVEHEADAPDALIVVPAIDA